MGSLNPMLIGGAAVAGIATILLIVAVATPAWSEWNNRESGPFKSCVGSLCGSTSGGNSSVDAVKAMTIIGILFAFGALGAICFMAVLAVTGKSQISILPMAAAGAGIAAFIFSIIGAIIWAADINKDLSDLVDSSLGYSFALCIVGAILIGVGGVLGYLGGKKSD